MDFIKKGWRQARDPVFSPLARLSVNWRTALINTRITLFQNVIPTAYMPDILLRQVPVIIQTHVLPLIGI